MFNLTAQSNERHLPRTSPKTHELKCWPEFFAAIALGKKRHDLRRATDRDFRVGDTLLLREFDPAIDTYTGSTLQVIVTYVTSAEMPCALSEQALHPDFCILSIALHPKP
jgi:hypothetical protein